MTAAQTFDGIRFMVGTGKVGTDDIQIDDFPISRPRDGIENPRADGADFSPATPVEVQPKTIDSIKGETFSWTLKSF